MTMDVQPKASHFVNGAPMEDTGGRRDPLIYPATGERLGTVHAATAAVVEAALSSAEAAQAGWAAMTGAERGRVLTRAAAILRERNRELSELETLDTGKPLSETLVADAASGADCLEYFGGMAATLTARRSNWAAISPTRSASPWASARRSGRGTTRSRSPAGRPRRRWPAAMRWSSNRLKKRR
jgi:betaine-aldehyde dehydrogenase